VSTEGASHLLESVCVGLVIGAVAAIPAHLLLIARKLRWSWALVPTAAGALAVWATLIESWSVALLVGGVCASRWAYLLERRDREAGSDARCRARQAIGMLDVLRRRRARRQLREGTLVADGSFLLGADRKGLPVRLRFGAGSGRHGLLLGASGAGKSNALLWTVTPQPLPDNLATAGEPERVPAGGDELFAPSEAPSLPPVREEGPHGQRLLSSATELAAGSFVLA
jgi:hypothetical protein